MGMAVWSVTAPVKHDRAIQRRAVQPWARLAAGLDGRIRTTPIAASPLRDRLHNICPAPGRPAACMVQGWPAESVDDERPCGPADGQSPRSGRAPAAAAAGQHPEGLAGPSPRGPLGTMPGRRLEIRPWHVPPAASPAPEGRALPVEAQRRPGSETAGTSTPPLRRPGEEHLPGQPGGRPAPVLPAHARPSQPAGPRTSARQGPIRLAAKAAPPEGAQEKHER
jgi:hypothetical protein